MRSAPTKLGTKHRKAVSNRLLETRAYLFVMPVMSLMSSDAVMTYGLDPAAKNPGLSSSGQGGGSDPGRGACGVQCCRSWESHGAGESCQLQI